jgi:hypothetical protein
MFITFNKNYFRKKMTLKALTITNNIYSFYRDGFKRMTLGKRLWTIILIKLFIMFFVLKLFFFPNYLNTNFQTNKERSNHVLEQITRTGSINK